MLLRESLLPHRCFPAEHDDLLIDDSSMLAVPQSRCVLVSSCSVGSSWFHLSCEVRRLQFVHGRIDHELAALLYYFRLPLRTRFLVDVFELRPTHVEGYYLAGVVGQGADLILNTLGVGQVFHVQLHVRELGGHISGLHILMLGLGGNVMMSNSLLIPTVLTQVQVSACLSAAGRRQLPQLH